jgi:hypothetical protein
MCESQNLDAELSASLLAQLAIFVPHGLARSLNNTFGDAIDAVA